MDFYIVKIGLEFARNYWILGIISCPIIEWRSLGNFMPCLGLFSSGRNRDPAIAIIEFERVFFQWRISHVWEEKTSISRRAFSLIRDRDHRWNFDIRFGSNSGPRDGIERDCFEFEHRAGRGGGEGNLQRSVNRLHSIEQMKNNKRHSWTLKELPRGENCASLPLLIIISISVPESVPCTENYKTNQLPLPFPSSLSQKYVFRKISWEFNQFDRINETSVEKLF